MCVYDKIIIINSGDNLDVKVDCSNYYIVE